MIQVDEDQYRLDLLEAGKAGAYKERAEAAQENTRILSEETTRLWSANALLRSAACRGRDMLQSVVNSDSEPAIDFDLIDNDIDASDRLIGEIIDLTKETT